MFNIFNDFNNKLALDRKLKKLLKVLFLIVVATVLLHIFWQVIYFWFGSNNIFINDLTNRFGLDEELSFPTWVNSMLAFIAAIFAFLVSEHQSAKSKKLIWRIIAAVSLIISIDEVMALHELLLQSLHILANFGEKQTWFANAWLIVMPVIFAGLVILTRLTHKQLPIDTFKNLAIAGVVYLAGALVVEYTSIPMDNTKVAYNLIAVVAEESLELIGVWLAIRAILVHILRHEQHLADKLKGLVVEKAK